MKKSNWTREETILAFELYCRTPFGKMHQRNPNIILLAQMIGRTPSAVALKLGNFASLDNSIQQKGMSNFSKIDKAIWKQY